MQARYLHKWTSAIEGIEDIVVNEWAQKIAGLTEIDIARGLETWRSAWPPSVDEFVNACCNKGGNDFGLGYVPEYYRNLRHRKLLESEELKKQRKITARKNLILMREKLNGRS